MKTIRDVILEKFVQKEIEVVSSRIADTIMSIQGELAHDIAREEDSVKSDELKQRYKKLSDLYISVAVNATCGDVRIDELKSAGIEVDVMIRRAVTT